jgi:hypothetical protein
VLAEPVDQVSIEGDYHCLALLKHYRSLMPMAQEAHKPMFSLKPADGAIGAHTRAVQDAYRDFERLAHEVANRTALPLPDPLGMYLTNTNSDPASASNEKGHKTARDNHVSQYKQEKLL